MGSSEIPHVQRRGMMFKARTNTMWEGQKIYEHLGEDYDDEGSKKLLVREWKICDTKKQFGPGVEFQTVEGYAGAAGIWRMSTENPTVRIVYKCHTDVKKKNIIIIEGIIDTPRVTMRNFPQHKKSAILETICRKFEEQEMQDNVTAFPDGSWKKGQPSWQKPFEEPDLSSHWATAGLVYTHDDPNWKKMPMIAIHIAGGHNIRTGSAYSMEVLGLMLALAVAKRMGKNHRIVSDCQSAIDTIQPGVSHDPKQLRGKDCGFITMAMRDMIPKGIAIEKVKSHVEKRQTDRTQWSYEEYGNVLADRAAGERGVHIPDTLHREFKQIHVFRVEAAEIIQELMPPTIWNLYAPQMFPVPSSALDSQLNRMEHSDYVSRRTTNSACIGRNRNWVDMDIELAAHIWDMPKRKGSVASQINRIIFDLHWHGGNRSKEENLSQQERNEQSKCNLCGRTDSQDHILNSCRNPIMKMVRTEGMRMILHHLREGSRQIETSAVTTELIKIWQQPTISPEMWIGRWKKATTTTIVELVKRHNPNTEPGDLREQVREAYTPIIATVYMLYTMRGAMMSKQAPQGRLRGISPREEMFLHLVLPKAPPLIETRTYCNKIESEKEGSNYETTSTSNSMRAHRHRPTIEKKAQVKVKKHSYEYIEASRPILAPLPRSRRIATTQQLEEFVHRKNTDELNGHARKVKLEGWETCAIRESDEGKGLELIATIDLPFDIDNPKAWRYDGKITEISDTEHIEDIPTRALVYGCEYVHSKTKKRYRVVPVGPMGSLMQFMNSPGTDAPNMQLVIDDNNIVWAQQIKEIRREDPMTIDYGDYYWLNCWQRLSHEDQKSLRERNQNIQYPPLWPITINTVRTARSRAMAEWQYLVASKNIYDCLQEENPEEGKEEESEGKQTDKREDDESEERLNTEVSEDEVEDDIANIDISGDAIVRITKLTRQNLVAQGPVPDAKQKNDNTHNWLQEKARPTGWHIRQIESTVDEIIVAMIYAAEQITIWYNESKPTGTLIACRQALHDLTMTADTVSIRNGEYGEALKEALEEDRLSNEGTEDDTKRKTAARLTRQATDQTRDISSIYVDPIIGTKWINTIIRNRSKIKTKKHLDSHPIQILQGTDSHLITLTKDIDIFIKWEKGKTEVWTRNCKRLIPQVKHRGPDTQDKRKEKAASETMDMRKFLVPPPSIPESIAGESPRTMTNENSSISSVGRRSSSTRNSRISRIRRTKPLIKGKGHREDDKIP